MSKTITLKSSDDQVFTVEAAVAFQSLTIKTAVEDASEDENSVVPMHEVDGDILGIIVKYCEKHANQPEEDDEEGIEDMKKFDADFVNLPQEILYHLFMAANYLDIPSLLDLIAAKVADMIRGKSVEDIRKLLNIRNDFTPEQEREIRDKNPWAFQ